MNLGQSGRIWDNQRQIGRKGVDRCLRGWRSLVKRRVYTVFLKTPMRHLVMLSREKEQNWRQNAENHSIPELGIKLLSTQKTVTVETVFLARKPFF